MTPHILDNPVWAALTTFHSGWAEGGPLARRYRRGVTPIAAVTEPTAEAYAALASLLEPGEAVSVGRDELGVPGDVFEVEVDEAMPQRVCPVAPPEVAARAGFEPVTLGDADVPQMLALTELTHPGPFDLQTHRLGTFLGIKVDGRLVAMAGERFHLPGYHEISAVCTHPDWQGHGFARLLVSRLARAMHARGLTPFLHVLADNTRAAGLYERLGFTVRRTLRLQKLRRR